MAKLLLRRLLPSIGNRSFCALDSFNNFPHGFPTAVLSYLRCNVRSNTTSRWFHHCKCTATWNPSPYYLSWNNQPKRMMFSTKPDRSSCNLIYQGPLTTVVKGVKFFSLSTTIMSTAVIPLLLTYGDSGVMTTIGISFAMMMLATPILLHWLSRSYITKIYYDESDKVYIAKTVTFILREATHRFTERDVAVPSVRNIFTTFVAHGRPFLVDPRGFLDPNQFSRLMGHDQMLSQEEIDRILKEMKDDED